MTFQFRPVLTIFAVVGVAILVSLGVWQLHRREWKLDLIAKTEARVKREPVPFEEAVQRAEVGEDMDYTPVILKGVYANNLEAPVFGTLDGEAGGYIFTPLDISPPGGKQHFVYVDRGFVPQHLLAPQTRPEGEIAGEITVRGLFRSAENPAGIAKLFAPADTQGDNLWFRRDPGAFAARQGIEASPYYIDSSGAENPAPWPKGGVTRLHFYNRHLEYALTWFGLAFALVGVYIASSLKPRQAAASGGQSSVS